MKKGFVDEIIQNPVTFIKVKEAFKDTECRQFDFYYDFANRLNKVSFSKFQIISLYYFHI